LVTNFLGDKKMKSILGMLLFVGIVSSAAETKQTPAMPQTVVDGYLEIFKQRVELAKVAIEKQHVEIAMNKEEYDMHLRLYTKGVQTEERLRQHRRTWEISKVVLKELELKAKETEALYQMIVARASFGLEIPVIIQYQ